MSNNQIVVDTLIKKRDQLIAQKAEILEKFESEINEIEDALDRLAGKEVWRTRNLVAYDDENPDYIRQSQEEI